MEFNQNVRHWKLPLVFRSFFSYYATKFNLFAFYIFNDAKKKNHLQIGLLNVIWVLVSERNACLNASKVPVVTKIERFECMFFQYYGKPIECSNRLETWNRACLSVLSSSVSHNTCKYCVQCKVKNVQHTDFLCVCVCVGFFRLRSRSFRKY